MAKDKITDYSATASENADVGGIGIEGSDPITNFDNALREFMTHLAETNAGTYPVDDTWSFCDPAARTKIFRFDGGSITAGQTRVITLPDANVTIPSGTIMVAGSYPTAVSLEGLTLAAGDILYATAADTLAKLAKGTADQVLTMNDGATAPEWTTLPAAANAVNVGSLMAYAGAAAPTGWLLCYGQAISRATYSALFTAISTTYGTGDGSTTFNVPDLRGRVVAGQDDMGGTSANRLTSPAATTGGIDGDVLGGTGGAETHTLTVAQMQHKHTNEFPVNSDPTNDNALDDTSAVASTTATAHNNVQPTIILNWIIYTGV